MHYTILVIIMYKIGIVIVILLHHIQAKGQLAFTPIDSLPMRVASGWLKYPLAGGFNAPQFIKIDFNADGMLDLMVFDRVGNAIIPFINNGAVGGYRYAPQYKTIFPELYDWVQLVDYNCDNVLDIFTSAGDSVRVIEGANLGGNLSWAGSSIYLTHYVSADATYKSIFVKDVDIPACIDADGDGDVDVLTFDPSGSYMELYENQSIENGDGCSALTYVLNSACWGGFFEPTITNYCSLGVSCRLSGEATTSLHPGSTTLAFDYENNGTLDILIGDIVFNNMNLLLNGSASVALMASQDTAFPSNDITINCYNFPAAYSGDYTNDGINDLIIAPNSESSNDNDNSAVLYVNNGTAAVPLFELASSQFLQNEMLDVGEGAFPASIDMDNDGDLDLLIGNFNRFVPPGSNNSSRISYYKNIGTTASPQFELITDDWLSLSTFSPLGSAKQSFIPTFGDIDADGDKDLLIGEYSGSIFYFKNTAVLGGEAVFTFINAAFSGIDVGQCAAPQLVDANRDGLLDLIIGERNGNINYYQNRGSAAVPLFDSLYTQLFGGVNVKEPAAVTGYAMPCLIDNGPNNYLLVVGSESGKIYFYTNIDGNLDGVFTPTNELANLKCGKKVAPSFMNLDADPSPELLVGNYRGGLSAFDIANWVGLSDAVVLPFVKLYPNPAANVVNLTANELFTYQLLNIQGQVIAVNMSATAEHSVNLEGFSNGTYMIRCQFKTQIVTKKIIKL